MSETPIIGRISSHEDGTTAAAKSMAASLELMNVHTDNIANSSVPGYQAQRPIQRPFVEYLGAYSVQRSTSEVIGRIRNSGQMTDLALNTEGYFQRLDPATGQIETTRDGRFMVNAQGQLTSINGKPFLNQSGLAIVLPKALLGTTIDVAKQVQVDTRGGITVIEPKTGKSMFVGKFAVVSSQGDPINEPQISQGYVEDSNVYLAQEFTGLMPLRREFEANRQIYLLQSGNLQKMIQDLSRTQ